MPRYKVTLSEQETEELEALIKRGGKGYRIKHAQILLKLDAKPENKNWTYERIQEAYSQVTRKTESIASSKEAKLGRIFLKKRFSQLQ